VDKFDNVICLNHKHQAGFCERQVPKNTKMGKHRRRVHELLHSQVWSILKSKINMIIYIKMILWLTFKSQIAIPERFKPGW